MRSRAVVVPLRAVAPLLAALLVAGGGCGGVVTRDSDPGGEPATKRCLASAPWTRQQALNSSFAGKNDYFGASVAVSGDTAVVGAWRANFGSAYAFTRSGSTWTEQQRLTAAESILLDHFGAAVAVDGARVIVGVPLDDDEGLYSGSAYVFTLSNATWKQQEKLTASDGTIQDFFGTAVAVNGDTTVVGAPSNDGGGSGVGAVYAFVWSGTAWSEERLVVSDTWRGNKSFGGSVAVDGDTVVGGAPGDDEGGVAAGAAYVFTRSGSTWSQQKLMASEAAERRSFGGVVAVSGDTIVVGAAHDDEWGTDSGSAYVFSRNGSTWTEQQRLVASDASGGQLFGAAVAVDGDTVVVGAPAESVAGAVAGSVHVFSRAGDAWVHQQQLEVRDAPAGYRFGGSLAISGRTLVVGALSEEAGAGSTGTVYVFERCLPAE